MTFNMTVTVSNGKLHVWLHVLKVKHCQALDHQKTEHESVNWPEPFSQQTTEMLIQFAKSDAELQVKKYQILNVTQKDLSKTAVVTLLKVLLFSLLGVNEHHLKV